MPRTHEELIHQVNTLFKFYDSEGSGYLENKEMERLLHDLALELRVKKGIKENDYLAIRSKLDKNQVGRITRDELYVVLQLIN